jgi:glycosyltransferase involved in cell wall biosynthesis
LVPPGNVEQVVVTLIKTMKNRNLQKNLAENGVLSVKEHDIRVVATKIADIYNSLLLK